MLGRNPAEFRLIGDEGGWISIRDIHKALLEEKLFSGMTPRGIEQYLLLFRPEGFEASEGKVRVLPELQKPGIFDYQPARPPDMLFAAIRPRALTHADISGLTATGEKRWIVLFSSRKEALLFGKRFHNRPVLCKIIAEKAAQDGAIFLHAGAGLYLSRKIGRQWLVLPQIKEKLVRDKSKKELSEKGTLNELDSETEFIRHIGSFSPSTASFEELFHIGSGRSKRRSRKRFKYIDKKKRKK